MLLVSMQRELPIHALTHAAAIALADQPGLHATVDERVGQRHGVLQSLDDDDRDDRTLGGKFEGVHGLCLGERSFRAR